MNHMCVFTIYIGRLGYHQQILVSGLISTSPLTKSNVTCLLDLLDHLTAQHFSKPHKPITPTWLVKSYKVDALFNTGFSIYHHSYCNFLIFLTMLLSYFSLRRFSYALIWFKYYLFYCELCTR